VTTRLICTFVVTVSLLATSFPNRFSDRNLSRLTIPHAAADGDNSGARLVQEPSRRAFRPDTSSGHLKRGNQRSSLFMLRAFNEALGDSWKSTVRFMYAGEQVALGAVVDSEGWIVTKASQLPRSGEITCRTADGREAIASVVSRLPEHDLALVHIPESKLIAITWDHNSTPERGKWLATTDLRATPIAVGVISAGVQNIVEKFPKLGVHLEATNGGGAVSMVLPGSGADEAGIRTGDTLYAVNGKVIPNREAFISEITNVGKAGEFIRIGVDRAERRFEVEARLMDLSDELLDKTEMEVNGRVSARATGFNTVFSHDTVLEPEDCGGPLVNLDGKAVGINIARAGRVTSYALPAKTVKPLVDSMLAQAKLVSTSTAPTQSTLRPIR
jgi:serine protease Do